MKFECFVATTILLFAGIVQAEPVTQSSFEGILTPERNVVQRVVMPSFLPTGQYSEYRYHGSYVSADGIGLDVFYDKELTCKGNIEVRGSLAKVSIHSCKEVDQAKCDYSATQLFVKKLKCIN